MMAIASILLLATVLSSQVDIIDLDRTTMVVTTPEQEPPPTPAQGSFDQSILMGLTDHFVEIRGEYGGTDVVYKTIGSEVQVLLEPGRVRLIVGIDDTGHPSGPSHPSSIVQIDFLGARSVTPEGREPLGHRTNLFIGNDPSCWVRNALDFGRVRYGSVYDGVDIEFYISRGCLKYDLILGPHVDPGVVRFAYLGMEALVLDGPSGDLLIKTPSGDLRDEAPIAYQEGPRGREWVWCAFKLLDRDIIGFDLSGYDPTRALIIDPTMAIGTYIGGVSDDLGRDLYVDASGMIYIAGLTKSSGFPRSADAYDPTQNGNVDAVFLKLKPDGSDLIYATFIGGSQDDLQTGFLVEDNGSVVMVGETWSTNFPMKYAIDNTHNGGSDIYVLRLSATGDDLLFSTYYGGSGNDRGWRVDGDPQGNIVVVGTTWSGIPTTAGAYQTSFGGNFDAYALKLDPSGRTRLWATHLGRSNMDAAEYVTVAPSGIIYITGPTQSSNFPTTQDGYSRVHGGGWDSFVAALSSDGSTLLHSTLIGGSGDDYSFSMTLDDLGRVYIIGYSQSPNYPTTSGAYDRNLGGTRDIQVGRLDANLTTLQYSTFIGGNGEDTGTSIVVDARGRAYITGLTNSVDFPVSSDALYSTRAGDYDAYLVMLDENATSVQFSTYLGGTLYDQGARVFLRDSFIAYVVGFTNSLNFPTTTGSYDVTANGNRDIFLTSIQFSRPPRWLSLPTDLMAVEDVPFDQSFASFVEDPDTSIHGLTISSPSSYVTKVEGLNVTFTFPNGVLTATVLLWLSDGGKSVRADVNFTVTPVNDAPTCSLSREQTAIEDVPMSIDFEPYVRDVDNDTSELYLIVQDLFASAVGLGLNLTAVFPEGVLNHTMYLNLTDGIALTEVVLNFTIIAVDDLPEVDELPAFTAIEDRPSLFKITPFLHDIDTPVERLAVTVRDINCSVTGQELVFTFPRGGLELDVRIEVNDAHSRIYVTLHIIVEERDDAPIVHGISPKLFTEGEPKTIDLSPYIEDEDNPSDDLSVSSNDPNIVTIQGFNITLLYDTWMEDYTFNFTVTDGMLSSNGHFEVQINAVNDPPIIIGIGRLKTPYLLTMNESAELWLDVLVWDEDSNHFRYAVEGQWKGVTAFQNGTLHFVTSVGEIENFTVTIVVDDFDGGIARASLDIVMVNVNDPPSRLILLAPLNNTIIEEGSNVTFSVDVSDPDLVLGQQLVVVWVSNMSGIIRTITGREGFSFITDSLPVGVHRITVSVNDGEYTRELSFELTVLERYEPPPKPDDPSFLTQKASILAILIVVVLVLLGTVMTIILGRRRDEADDRSAITASESVIVATDDHGIASGTPKTGAIMEGDLLRLHTSLGEMAARLEAERVVETVLTPPSAHTEMAPEQLGPAVMSPEDEADRELTMAKREVMKTLTQLPQGLPNTLWGWDMAELATAIVEGERRTTQDGTPLVNVKGRWYNVDLSNLGMFLREWKEPETQAAFRPHDLPAGKEARLERLEMLLLEGRISEQTYQDLKRKYEKG